MTSKKYTNLYRKKKNENNYARQNPGDAKAVNDYISRIQGLLKDEDKAKKAAQIISELFNAPIK